MSNADGSYGWYGTTAPLPIGYSRLDARLDELERKMDLLKEAFDSMNASLEKVYEATLRFLETMDHEPPRDATWGTRS